MLRASILSLVLTLIVLTAAFAAENILANGSFEKAEAGKPAGWFLAIADGGKAVAEVTTEGVKQGKQAAKVTGSAEWAVLVSPRIAIEKGKTYTVTGHVRPVKGAGQIKIDYFDKDGEYLDSTYGSGEMYGDSWQKDTVTSELTLHPNATHLSAAGVATGDFEVHFDAFEVTVK